MDDQHGTPGTKPVAAGAFDQGHDLGLGVGVSHGLLHGGQQVQAAHGLAAGAAAHQNLRDLGIVTGNQTLTVIVQSLGAVQLGRLGHSERGVEGGHLVNFGQRDVDGLGKVVQGRFGQITVVPPGKIGAPCRLNLAAVHQLVQGQQAVEGPALPLLLDQGVKAQVIGQQQGFEVGVSLEVHAEKIETFLLVPVRPLKIEAMEGICLASWGTITRNTTRLLVCQRSKW